MISSDVSLISALGPAPGANTIQDAGNPAAGAAGFAALVDQAALTAGKAAAGKAAFLMGATSAGVAAPADAAGAAEPFFIADWSLPGLDIMAAFQQVPGDATSSDEDVAVEGEKSDGDGDQQQLEGVLNIEWLFARPVRMWTGDQSKHAEGSQRSGGSRSGGSIGSGGSGSAGSSNEIPADAMRMLDAPIAADAAPAAQRQANLEAAPESMEKALTDALKQQPEKASVAEAPVKAAQAAATPKNAPAQASVEPQMDTTAAQAAVAPDMPVADTSRPAASEAPVESAAKPSAAATRFAKAIERLHGSTPDAVVVERGQAFSGQSSSGQENAPGFGSAHRDVAPTAPVRSAHVETATFTVPALGDIQRTLDTAARMVEVETSAGPTLPEADTLRQLVQTMRMQFKDGIGDAVVRLRPEHLGEVSISLRVDQQSVTATVHAEVAAVRQWLETQEASLRSGLAEQGLNLEKLVVLKDGQQQSQQDEQAERQGRRQRRSRNGEPEPKFEITV